MTDRPKLLFTLSDQQRPETSGRYGGPNAHAPHRSSNNGLACASLKKATQPVVGLIALLRIACAFLGVYALATQGLTAAGSESPVRSAPSPNVVFILADDLGFGEVSVQGQRLVETPHIDRLAAEGLRFTRHYAGSAVCAPSRCTLITGRHTGHCSIRDNVGVGPDGAEIRPSLPANVVTVAEIFRQAGYATAAIGKWGLGDEGTAGVPWEQGFDLFFGYLHNTHGTRYYTEFIYRNEEKIALRGNYGRWRNQYGPDLCLDEARRFLEDHHAQPFFLYYPFNLVHGGYIDPPPDAALPPIVPPAGVAFSAKEQTYLRMIQRLDRDVGRIVALIDDLELADRTLIVFTSDNGSKPLGEPNDALFNGTGGLRGGKADLYEGGIRVPFIARWPGVIAPGTVSDHPSTFWDFLPTACNLVGSPEPPGCDGISYLPTLLDRPQAGHQYLYWELAKRDEPMVIPKQALACGPWKALRNGDDSPELYNLDSDPDETNDLADRHPEILADLVQRMEQAHVDDPTFPLETGPGFE